MRYLIYLFFLFSTLIFNAQDNKSICKACGNVTGTFWFVDGIKILNGMSTKSKNEALKAIVKYINGKWVTDPLKQIYTFRFSPQFYTGHYTVNTANGVDTTNAKLEIIKGDVYLIKYNKGNPIDTSLIRGQPIDTALVEFKQSKFCLGRQLFIRVEPSK